MPDVKTYNLLLRHACFWVISNSFLNTKEEMRTSG